MERYLRDLGLTRLETKAYKALLGSSGKTAAEVALEIKVGREAVYRILKSLLDKGIIGVFGKRPRIFRSLPPEVGVANLLHVFQLAADSLLNKKVFSLALYPLRIVRNRDEYHRMGKDYFKQAKKEVLVIASGTGDLSPEFTKTMTTAVRAGVTYRILAMTAEKANIDQLKSWQKNGFEVRYRHGKGFNLVNYDRETVQIGLRIAEGTKEKYGLVISHADLAAFLGAFFDFLWITSKIL